MGTHSLIIMQTVDPQGRRVTYCVLYQQYDGYPEGVGIQLLQFLKGIVITNGIPFRQTFRVANGAGDLFAQIVSHFKGSQIGGAYLVPPQAYEHEEYNYIVTVDEEAKTIGLTIMSGSKVLHPDMADSNPEAWLKKWDALFSKF